MEENKKIDEISEDDKLISLVVHLSAIFGGIILPIVIYFMYKEKSKFVVFNALQALFYQIMFLIFFFIIWVVMIVILVMFGFNYETLDSVLNSKDWFVREFITYSLMGLFILLEGIYALLLGLKAYKGKIVKYILVGQLAYDSVYGRDKSAINLKQKPDFDYTSVTPKKPQGRGLI